MIAWNVYSHFAILKNISESWYFECILTCIDSDHFLHNNQSIDLPRDKQRHQMCSAILDRLITKTLLMLSDASDSYLFTDASSFRFCEYLFYLKFSIVSCKWK